MAVSILEWLSAQGFSRNPFEYWEADREIEQTTYFVRAPWFDALLGDTRRPGSAVLFAPRGHGKSSCRIQIMHRCSTQTNAPALVVPVLEFDWLLNEGLDRVDEPRCLRFIVRRTARVLWEQMQESEARRTAVAADPLQLLHLNGLLRWSSDPNEIASYTLDLPAPHLLTLAKELRIDAPLSALSEALVERMVSHYRAAEQHEILEHLTQAVLQAGYASLYVLVDRVDEISLTENDPVAAVRLIRPMISNLPLVEHRHIAFKFFLPDLMQRPMQENRIGRINERMPAYTLQWTHEALIYLLGMRVRAFSRIGSLGDVSEVNSFQDLCETGADADARIVMTAGLSPRDIIRLARDIVEVHCNKTNTLHGKISSALLDTLLVSRAVSVGEGGTPARMAPAVDEPASHDGVYQEAGAEVVPQLRLDGAGHIWLGERLQSIELARLPRMLLELLWAKRGQYVTKKDVARALYQDDDANEAAYKVVMRLRKELEPSKKNSRTYIDLVEGIGYRLCNYQE